jgi:hypothetical protein
MPADPKGGASPTTPCHRPIALGPNPGEQGASHRADSDLGMISYSSMLSTPHLRPQEQHAPPSQTNARLLLTDDIVLPGNPQSG